MFRVVICIPLLFIYMQTLVGQLPRLRKRELICLLLFTCNYVVSVKRGFLLLLVLGMGYVILLWHSLRLPYNYFAEAILIGTHYIDFYEELKKISLNYHQINTCSFGSQQLSQMLSLDFN